MKDRNTLLHDIEIALSTVIDLDILQDAVDKIAEVVQSYEVQERCTSIVPVDDKNENILKKYAACLYVDGRSTKTIGQYIYRLKDFYNKLRINLDEVGVYDIRMYLAILKQRGNSNSTIEGVRQYLSAFYKWMHLEGLVQKNPCDLLKPIKFHIEKEDPFSDLEIEKLRNSCKNTKERALFEFLLSTGVRVSELCDMNKNDVDFQDKIIRVLHGKGDKERITYISDVALYYLRQYFDERNDKNTALFITKTGRIHPGGVRFILHEIESRSDVCNVHPHRFRHTFASVLNNNGMPIQHIQQLLGHTKLDTTMIYVTVDKNQVEHEYHKYMRI